MSKTKSIFLWVLQILLVALFLMASFPKLTSKPEAVERFRNYGYPDHFYLLIGALELLGAILLLIPKLAAYGASALVVNMIGASLTHLLNDEAPKVLVTGTLMILLAVIAYVRRPEFIRKRQKTVAP